MSTKPMMAAARAEAAPENQAGNYSASFWFSLFIVWIESRFPGAGALVQKAADILPWSKLGGTVYNAIADWKEGKDFLAILQEMLDEWVVIEKPAGGGEIRMTAKKPA